MLNRVRNSQIFRTIRKPLRVLIPGGSRREKFVLTMLGALSIIRHRGFAGLLKAESWRPGEPTTSTAVFTYEQWISLNEPGETDLQNQAAGVNDLPSRPLISIVTPVYNPPLDVLEQTILSVMAQSYPDWELCLVNGDATNQEVEALIQRYAAQSPRIRVRSLPENRGISGNSNACLEMAQGEFVAFLDHDDTLAPFALYEVARYLGQHADCDLLYSDHDLLDAVSGKRKSPLFKPDWSPDIMLSSNYITHLTVVQKEIVQAVGGFDPRKDGAQDWDLYLRVAERARHIGHIPKVLYHWRESASSTAANIYTKAYAPAAQLRSIEDHLARVGLPSARAFLDPAGFIRVAWNLARQGKVTIIIPSRGANKMLENCIRSIFAKTAYPDYEVLVVNNGSRRPEDFRYYKKLCENPRARVIHYEGTFNYSAVNNFGVRSSESEYILLLNNDTEVIHEDWLSEMVMWASRPEVGAVGAKLLLPDGRIQHAGVILGLTGFAGHVFGGRPEGEWGPFGLAEWYRDYLAVTAACVMFRREVYEKLGGLDETFLLCGNDVELGMRLNQSGYRVLYHPFVRLHHLESATHKGTIPNEDFYLSFECYSHVLKSGDPFFNPNLSHWDLAPRLRQPGEPLPYEFAKSHLETLRKGI